MKRQDYQQHKRVSRKWPIAVAMLAALALFLGGIVLAQFRHNQMVDSATSSTDSESLTTTTAPLASSDSASDVSEPIASDSTSQTVDTSARLAESFPYMVALPDGDFTFHNSNSYAGNFSIMVEYASDLNPDPRVNSSYTQVSVLNLAGEMLQIYQPSTLRLVRAKQITVLYGEKKIQQTKTVKVNSAIALRDASSSDEAALGQFGMQNSTLYLYHGRDGNLKLAIPTPSTFINANYQELTIVE